MKRFLPFLLIFTLFSSIYFPAVAQENETRIEGGTLCPSSQFIVPVFVSNLINVDSISLTLLVPGQTLSYLSSRQPNPLFAANSFVVKKVDNRVVLTWASDGPVSISNEKLIDLIFTVNKEPVPGTLEFDQNISYYHGFNGSEITSSYIDAQILLFPTLFVELEEIDATCPGDCSANIAAFVTGGKKPYSFLWNGDTSPFDSIMTGVCGGRNDLLVTDANECTLDTSFQVSTLLSAKVDMEFDPDTVYIQNPKVTFSFTEDQNVVEWIWDFGDGSDRSIERNPTHVYSTASTPDLEGYTVSLTVTSSQGCDTTILRTIPISEVDLFIPNVFTPNGDNINDSFVIAKKNDGGSSSGSEYIPVSIEYIRLELVVLDRWGRKVFSSENYKNDWDGGNLPESTYYYRLNTFGFFKDESYKGAVTILRGGRN